MRGGEKAKDFKGTIGKLFRYIGKYKAAVVVVAIFAIGSTIFNVVCPNQPLKTEPHSSEAKL